MNKKVIGVLALVVVLVVSLGLKMTSKSLSPKKAATEVGIEDLVVGSGDEAVVGKSVSVNYTGRLSNGKKFDSSYDHNQAFKFNLGRGQVIQGWDKGIVGMKVGGKRKLTIPSDFAYGDNGAGNIIPPKETLTFEIELLKVEDEVKVVEPAKEPETSKPAKKESKSKAKASKSK